MKTYQTLSSFSDDPTLSKSVWGKIIYKQGLI